MNVHNYEVFGAPNLEWHADNGICFGAYGEPVTDCGSHEQPEDAKESPAGIFAWLTKGANVVELCISKPALAACADDEPAMMWCGSLKPKKVEVKQKTATVFGPLPKALGRAGRVYLNHRGLESDDRGGCFEWEVTAKDGELVLTREDEENGRRVEPIRHITGSRGRYSSSWGKRFDHSFFDPQPKQDPPSPDDPRDSCPDPTETSTLSGTFLMCIVSLGSWVREAESSIDLSNFTFYKTRQACVLATKGRAALVPSCSSKAP